MSKPQNKKINIYNEVATSCFWKKICWNKFRSNIIPPIRNFRYPMRVTITNSKTRKDLNWMPLYQLHAVSEIKIVKLRSKLKQHPCHQHGAGAPRAALLLRTYNQPLREFPSKVSFKICNCSHVIELRDHFRVLVMINLIRNAHLIKRCLFFIDILLRPSTCGGPLKKYIKRCMFIHKIN
jgi:hypothetical protein